MTNTLREIRLRPNIADNDFSTKLVAGKRLLLDGSMVRFSVLFRGREITHPELGLQLLQRIIRDLSDIVEQKDALVKESRKYSITLSPRDKRGLSLAPVGALPKTHPPTLSGKIALNHTPKATL